MNAIKKLLEITTEAIAFHEYEQHDYEDQAAKKVNQLEKLEARRIALVHEKSIWVLKRYQQDLKIELDMDFHRE